MTSQIIIQLQASSFRGARQWVKTIRRLIANAKKRAMSPMQPNPVKKRKRLLGIVEQKGMVANIIPAAKKVMVLSRRSIGQITHATKTINAKAHTVYICAGTGGNTAQMSEGGKTS